MIRKIVFLICLAVLISFGTESCKKDPGEGGTSSISGKVFAKDYNSTFTVLQGEYYIPDVWVYILYGDAKDYGDKIRTGPDGTYEFKYLRPGSYRVYAYSKDSTLVTNAPIAVIQDVTIDKQNQSTESPDIVIFTVNGKN
jgi:hypothetical protein